TSTPAGVSFLSSLQPRPPAVRQSAAHAKSRWQPPSRDSISSRLSPATRGRGGTDQREGSPGERGVTRRTVVTWCRQDRRPLPPGFRSCRHSNPGHPPSDKARRTQRAGGNHRLVTAYPADCLPRSPHRAGIIGERISPCDAESWRAYDVSSVRASDDLFPTFWFPCEVADLSVWCCGRQIAQSVDFVKSSTPSAPRQQPAAGTGSADPQKSQRIAEWVAARFR